MKSEPLFASKKSTRLTYQCDIKVKHKDIPRGLYNREIQGTVLIDALEFDHFDRDASVWIQRRGVEWDVLRGLAVLHVAEARARKIGVKTDRRRRGVCEGVRPVVKFTSNARRVMKGSSVVPSLGAPMLIALIFTAFRKVRLISSCPSTSLRRKSVLSPTKRLLKGWEGCWLRQKEALVSIEPNRFSTLPAEVAVVADIEQFSLKVYVRL